MIPLASLFPCRKRGDMIEDRTKFALDANDGRKLLAAYFPVNDPLMPLSRLAAYDAAEVDVVELGIKTPHPFADGRVVNDAMKRSSGVGAPSEAAEAIQAVRRFSHRSMPMIFGYHSEVFASNPDFWAEVDGLLCLGQNETDRLTLCNTARARGTRITEFVPYEMPLAAREAAINAESFVLLQYLPGKTGARSEIDQLLKPRVAKMKRAGVQRPIFTGIGISRIDQIRHAVDTGADGVVIGTKTIEFGLQGASQLEDYLCQVREVLDGG